MERRRDATRLIYDILCLASHDTTESQLMHKTNLTHLQADTYVKSLVQNGHLQMGLDSNGTRKFLITQKGERLRYFLRYDTTPRKHPRHDGQSRQVGMRVYP